MTVEQSIKNIKGNIKGIYFRSLKNGEVTDCFKTILDINKEDLSKSTPGANFLYGRLIIDMF